MASMLPWVSFSWTWIPSVSDDSTQWVSKHELWARVEVPINSIAHENVSIEKVRKGLNDEAGISPAINSRAE